MSLTSPIADMLTRIRNALQAGHKELSIPASKFKVDVLAVLVDEGFIKKYRVVDLGSNKKNIIIKLKYDSDDMPVIEGIQMESRPSRRVYKASGDIAKIKNGFGISIVSTSKGVMSDKAARKENVGGEIICSVW